MRKSTLVLFVTGLLAFITSPLLASGGIYIGDVNVMSSDGTSFNDNFSTGDLSKWTKTANPNECSVICGGSETEKKSCALYLNRHSQAPITISPVVNFSNPVDVAISAKVWLPSGTEQYGSEQDISSSVMFQICSKTTKAKLMYGIETEYKKDGYLLSLVNEESSVNRSDVTTTKPVITPNKWVTIKLRTDMNASEIYAYVDGNQVLRSNYKPDEFGSIGTIQILSTLGDGALITGK